MCNSVREHIGDHMVITRSSRKSTGQARELQWIVRSGILERKTLELVVEKTLTTEKSSRRKGA
jgi:hypothetical protein